MVETISGTFTSQQKTVLRIIVAMPFYFSRHDLPIIRNIAHG